MFSNELECDAKIVETIAIGLTYNSSIISEPTFNSFIELVSNAKISIEIASFYWSLLGDDVMPHPDNSSIKGKIFLDELIKAGKERNVTIRIAVNYDDKIKNNTDLKLLSKFANIRQLNFPHLIGTGILHTKFIIIDSKHLYVGSANMDWRSLTHVKELGMSIFNCNSLATDLMKVFHVYWYLGKESAVIPQQWPKEYETNYNETNPLMLSLNNSLCNVYFSSAPKSFCPNGRINDIDAILSIINNSHKRISIAVMDYFPAFLYTKDHKFWPEIDDALKRAVIERKVHVRLLASQWNHTRHSMHLYLKSLAALNDSKILGGKIEVKLFIVPSNHEEAQIPFARVNHNKYMVTESVAYIGTSNWSADYFTGTGGVGFVIKPNNTDKTKVTIRDDIESIFNRDWNSGYARSL